MDVNWEHTSWSEDCSIPKKSKLHGRKRTSRHASELSLSYFLYFEQHLLPSRAFSFRKWLVRYLIQSFAKPTFLKPLRCAEPIMFSATKSTGWFFAKGLKTYFTQNLEELTKLMSSYLCGDCRLVFMVSNVTCLEWAIMTCLPFCTIRIQIRLRLILLWQNYSFYSCTDSKLARSFSDTVDVNWHLNVKKLSTDP